MLTSPAPGPNQANAARHGGKRPNEHGLLRATRDAKNAGQAAVTNMASGGLAVARAASGHRRPNHGGPAHVEQQRQSGRRPVVPPPARDAAQRPGRRTPLHAPARAEQRRIRAQRGQPAPAPQQRGAARSQARCQAVPGQRRPLAAATARPGSGAQSLGGQPAQGVRQARRPGGRIAHRHRRLQAAAARAGAQPCQSGREMAGWAARRVDGAARRRQGLDAEPRRPAYAASRRIRRPPAAIHRRAVQPPGGPMGEAARNAAHGERRRGHAAMAGIHRHAARALRGPGHHTPQPDGRGKRRRHPQDADAAAGFAAGAGSAAGQPGRRRVAPGRRRPAAHPVAGRHGRRIDRPAAGRRRQRAMEPPFRRR
ncbi:Uncharacterised protein [Bordetella pertussis]|nr:Uncharacterised protein [Bordetella pertussis]CFM07754.1 Uncharacterised protein [Bordetella pertussis]CFM54404.1 Uncharacterised protein [Bordetella pertussis]CFN26633.1 Uncharacterised protein [Bordetella pertussis]CFN38941.1 Uncharacterised protein [Bordetella pertussis]